MRQNDWRASECCGCRLLDEAEVGQAEADALRCGRDATRGAFLPGKVGSCLRYLTLGTQVWKERPNNRVIVIGQAE